MRVPCLTSDESDDDDHEDDHHYHDIDDDNNRHHYHGGDDIYVMVERVFVCHVFCYFAFPLPCSVAKPRKALPSPCKALLSSIKLRQALGPHEALPSPVKLSQARFLHHLLPPVGKNLDKTQCQIL